jgi:hypothetical protein
LSQAPEIPKRRAASRVLPFSRKRAAARAGFPALIITFADFL